MVVLSRQNNAFQLQSTREFGLMYDCVATHLGPTSRLGPRATSPDFPKRMN